MRVDESIREHSNLRIVLSEAALCSWCVGQTKSGSCVESVKNLDSASPAPGREGNLPCCFRFS
jgi:hypothetical protein